MLLFDAIERIEIAIRTQIVNQLSLKYGSHWQDNRIIFKGPITRRRRDGSTFTDYVFADMQQHIRIDYITTALKHLSNIIATLIQNRKIRHLG